MSSRMKEINNIHKKLEGRITSQTSIGCAYWPKRGNDQRGETLEKVGFFEIIEIKNND